MASNYSTCLAQFSQKSYVIRYTVPFKNRIKEICEFLVTGLLSRKPQRAFNNHFLNYFRFASFYEVIL